MVHICKVCIYYNSIHNKCIKDYTYIKKVINKCDNYKGIKAERLDCLEKIIKEQRKLIRVKKKELLEEEELLNSYLKERKDLKLFFKGGK